MEIELVFVTLSIINGIGLACSRDSKAAYEYDSYIATIYLMLFDERTNRQRLANHLRKLATTSMVLSDGRELRERCDLAATALMSLRSEFTTH